MNSRYRKLLLDEKEGDYDFLGFPELVACGRCQFCGTHSKMGYWVKQKSTGKTMLVGTECVKTLTKLTASQERAFNSLQREQKHKIKYAPMKAYLKEAHKNELISTNKRFHEKHNSKYVIIKEDDKYVHYKWTNQDETETYCQSKELIGVFYRETYVADLSYGVVHTPLNIASIILNKINTTTSPIHKFWTDTYKELTGVDLKKIGDTK